VFTARYTLSTYIKQIRFVFKGLNELQTVQQTIHLLTAKPLNHPPDHRLTMQSLMQPVNPPTELHTRQSTKFWVVGVEPGVFFLLGFSLDLYNTKHKALNK
jgi:hypothetical protein